MASTFLKPLACFEPSFERFATVADDGRIKIFDVRSGNMKQQLAEKTHLATRYTALAWGASPQDQGRSKRAKKQQNGGVLAAGTARGSIVVWDVARGEVVQTLGGKEGHAGKINSLVFAEGSTFLYSCSDDLHIIKWNVDSGEVVSKFKADSQAVTGMALSADNASLATSSTTVKLWDLASAKSVKKFTGHVSTVTCLDFSADGRYVVSGSSDERFVSVWDAENGEKDRAAAVFTAPSNPSYVEFNKAQSSAATSHTVLALLRSGVACLWEVGHTDQEAGKVKSQKPGCTIRVMLGPKSGGATTARKGQVYFAQFTDEQEVIVVYGTRMNPLFERVNLVNDAGQLKKEIVINDETTSATGALIADESGRDKKTAQARAANVLGPVQTSAVVKAGVVPSTALEAAAATKKADKKAAATAKPKETLTLQEQLDLMQLSGADEANDEDKEEDAEDQPDAAKSALDAEVASLVGVWGGDKKFNKLKAHQLVPKATSLASALGQAVHTKDRDLLEKILSIGQQQIIFATVKRLDQKHVLVFLQLVLARFQAKPNRSVAMLLWIRALLVEHVAYLSTVPALLTTLSELYAAVQTRMANHKRYVSLAGRLELLDAQIKERNARAMANEANVAVYREDNDNGEDDDEEGVHLMDIMDDDEDDDVVDDDEEDDDDDDDEEEEIEDDGIEEDDDDDDGASLRRKRRSGDDDEDDDVDENDEGDDDGAEDDDDEDDENEEMDA